MKSTRRRHLLQTALLMTAGMRAHERASAQAPRLPFAVAPTSFDRSAPLGPLQPASKTGPFTEAAIWPKVNG
jgi:hypothetical protein